MPSIIYSIALQGLIINLENFSMRQQAFALIASMQKKRPSIDAHDTTNAMTTMAVLLVSARTSKAQVLYIQKKFFFVKLVSTLFAEYMDKTCIYRVNSSSHLVSIYYVNHHICYSVCKLWRI